MSPSFNSFGSLPSVSQLVWDTDLIIPEGKAIESASGEVGIIGDVNISGSLSSEGGLSAVNVTAENLVGLNAVISDKQLVIAKYPSNASVALSQIPSPVTAASYTSPDFPITGLTDHVQYTVPPITYYARDSGYYTSATFRLQAKVGDTYQTIAECTVPNVESGGTATTQVGVIPAGTTALRYVTSSNFTISSQEIKSSLSLSLTPLPVY